MMFAPINRLFNSSYPEKREAKELPSYNRNQFSPPINIEDNLDFLFAWQKKFLGDSFVYDYPLGRAHYGDLSYYFISKIIFNDVQKLKSLNLNGYISCQELRASFPNALPNYTLGRALSGFKEDFSDIVNDYFEHAYYPHHNLILSYLREVSNYCDCDYFNGKGNRINPSVSEKCNKLISCFEKYELPLEQLPTTIFFNLLRYHNSYGKKLIGVGIGVPGHISTDRKKLITNRKIWKNFSPELIRTSFSLPISFENNVRCMSYSKYLFDSSETPENFSYFHIGPGLYCSNFINGECLVGGSYLSGEIGHTIVSSSGPRCECGKYACLQTFASERWLIKYAKLQYENSSFSILNSLVKNSEEINISHITTAYSMGDVLIRNSISTALKYLGNSISNIAILLNPDKIFLHSELFNNEEIKSELLSLINEQLLFVDSEYSHNIILLPYSPFDGAVGAAAYSMNEHFILKKYN